MVTTVSLVKETSECWIGTDVDEEEVASPILRKPWKSVLIGGPLCMAGIPWKGWPRPSCAAVPV